MSIRPARKEDASSLAAISIEVWLGTYIRKGVNAFFADYALSEFTTSRFESTLDNEMERIWVSIADEGIDGFIRLTRGAIPSVEGCSDVEIASLYVQPRHQGKGAGSRLLDAGLVYCEENGAPNPWLAVNAENNHAVEYYLRNRFSIVGETHFRIQNEAYLNHILMYE